MSFQVAYSGRGARGDIAPYFFPHHFIVLSTLLSASTFKGARKRVDNGGASTFEGVRKKSCALRASEFRTPLKMPENAHVIS